MSPQEIIRLIVICIGGSAFIGLATYGAIETARNYPQGPCVDDYVIQASENFQTRCDPGYRLRPPTAGTVVLCECMED